EWGHGPIAKPLAGSPPVVLPRFACGCGQIGCLETVGSARGLERLHQHLSGEARDSRAIVAGWQVGEAEASRTIALYL
ncbi:ROK family protein, partial [Mycobacterium tuberculosis]|nr:ROK family protein [Mycobacterium tuberculosis]